MLAAGAMALAGCASFEAERSSRFVDENGAAVSVEYARGEEPKMPYKSKLKVRVTLPDGDRFTAYRHMSLAGVLYKTADEDWEYFEEGTACAVAQRADDGKGYILRFQGMMTMSSNAKDAMKKKPRITGSSTPQGFGRPSAGPRDSEGPRTVEKQ